MLHQKLQQLEMEMMEIAIVIAMDQMEMDLTGMAMVMEMVTISTSMQHQKLLFLVGQMETKMEEIMDLIVIAILFATDPTDLMEMDLTDQMEMDPMGHAARSHVKYV